MKLSIIIPAYNCGHLIGKCLHSLINQEISGGYEIIVVNDGSTDDTGQVLHLFETKYPSLFTIIEKPNGGVSSARNAGLSIAKGEWIYFCDADDWIQDFSLGKVLEFSERSDVGLIGFQLNHTSDRSFTTDSPVTYNVLFEGTGRDFFLRQLFWCTWLFVFKRCTIIDNVISFKPINTSEDGLFNVEYLLSMPANEIVINLDAKVYCYYGNPDSVTRVFDSKSAKSFLDLFFPVFNYYNDDVDRYGLTGELYERLQWVIAKIVPNYFARMVHSDFSLEQIRAESTRLKCAGVIPLKADKKTLSTKERFQGFLLQYPLLSLVFKSVYCRLKGYR